MISKEVFEKFAMYEDHLRPVVRTLSEELGYIPDSELEEFNKKILVGLTLAFMFGLELGCYQGVDVLLEKLLEEGQGVGMKEINPVVTEINKAFREHEKWREGTPSKNDPDLRLSRR